MLTNVDVISANADVIFTNVYACPANVGVISTNVDKFYAQSDGFNADIEDR